MDVLEQLPKCSSSLGCTVMHVCPNCQVSVVARTSYTLSCACVPVACCLAHTWDTCVSAWRVCATHPLALLPLGPLPVCAVRRACLLPRAPDRANVKAHGIGMPTHAARPCAWARAVSWHRAWAACPHYAMGCDAPTRMSTTHWLANLLSTCCMPCSSPMCTIHALSWRRLVQGLRQLHLAQELRL